jgi:hypothetical protein
MASTRERALSLSIATLADDDQQLAECEQSKASIKAYGTIALSNKAQSV